MTLIERIMALTLVVVVAGCLCNIIQTWAAKPRPPASLSKRLMTVGAILVFMYIAPKYLGADVWWTRLLQTYGLNWWG